MEKNINVVISLDFETGGLNYKKNPITQVGMVSFRPDNFKVIKDYKTEVQPYDNLEVEEKALEYTGLTMKQLLEDGKNVELVFNEMLEFFKVANINNARNHKPVLLGQNLAFDIDFLMHLFEKFKKDIKKYLVCDKSGRPFYFDTMYMAKMKWANEEISVNLESLLEKAGLEAHDAHDALNDVYATKELFQYLVNAGRDTEMDQENEERFRTTFEF